MEMAPTCVSTILNEHLKLIGIERRALRGYKLTQIVDETDSAKWTTDRIGDLRASLLRKDCSECRSFFNGTLQFSSMCIDKMDQLLLKLTHLHRLVLNNNRLHSVMCIPEKLHELYAIGNRISKLGTFSSPNELKRLDLSYNAINSISSNLSIKQIEILNLSYNDLCDLSSVVISLTELHHIRDLRLDGNPISMLPSYRQRIINCLSSCPLQQLDQFPIDEESRHHADPKETEKPEQFSMAIRLQTGVIERNPVPVLTAAPNNYTRTVTYHCEIRIPDAGPVGSDMKFSPRIELNDSNQIDFNHDWMISVAPSPRWRDYIYLLGVRIALYECVTESYRVSEQPETDDLWRQVDLTTENLIGCCQLDSRSHISGRVNCIISDKIILSVHEISSDYNVRTQWVAPLGSKTSSSITAQIAFNQSFPTDSSS